MISESPRKLFCIKITSMPTNPSWGQALQWIFIFSCCETQSLVCSSVSMVTSSSSCHILVFWHIIFFHVAVEVRGWWVTDDIWWWWDGDGEIFGVNIFQGWIFVRGKYFSGATSFQGGIFFRVDYFLGYDYFSWVNIFQKWIFFRGDYFLGVNIWVLHS